MSDNSEAVAEPYRIPGLPSPEALVAELLALDDLARHTKFKAVVRILGRAGKPDQQLYRDAIVKAGLKGARDMGTALTEATRIAEAERKAERKAEVVNPDERYLADNGCVYLVDDDGGRTLLAQFVPKIVAEVIRDDGTERISLVQIRVVLPTGQTGEAEILTEEAPNARKWAGLAVGARAKIWPMPRASEHVWTACQVLSGEAWTQTVRYAHTGWRHLASRHQFLTASGAIHGDGLDATVQVDLGSPRLNEFRLPDPAAVHADDHRAAVHASLELRRVAPDRIMIPLLAAVYRAPLPLLPDTTVWIYGPSGSLKTAVSAVAQQHFGAGMHAKALPAEWKSTANALELIAHALANVLLLIDDFAPQAVANPAQLNQTVDRVVRGAANTSARDRLMPDITMRPSKFPKAQLAASGEDLPSGQSLRARTTPVPVEPGDVDKKLLSEAQQKAADGIYALATAGYVQWLARRQDDNPKYVDELRSQMQQLRDEFDSTGHLRLPEASASLLIGWREFLRYAWHLGVVTDAEAKQIFIEAKTALNGLAGDQREQTRAFDPVQLYLAGIEQALVNGNAHLADQTTGAEPAYGDDAVRRSLGWDSFWAGDSRNYRANGEKIGWISATGDIYLEPRSAHTVAVQQTQRSRTPLVTSRETIHKGLKREGHVAETGKGTILVQRRMAGKRVWVLHLHRAVLLDMAADEPQPGEGDAA